MRLNSARPIKALTPKEQEGLRKLLFPTEQPEVFARSGTDYNPHGLHVSNTDDKPRKVDPMMQRFSSYITSSCMNFSSGMKNCDRVVQVLL